VDAIREPRSYLFQVANSIILGHLRHSRIVSISATADLDQFGVVAPEPSVEEHLVYRDELRILAGLLDRLPAPCRSAFALRRIGGLSQRETAERLGISEKTVEKYMAKSVRLLMDSFGRGGKSSLQASRKTKETDQSVHDPKIVEPGS
jgi:RNA polymerase sigma-70 factor (ECF subfamily)